MIRTVALIALVGSAAAYQSDELFCTQTYNALTCDSYTTNITCAANTKCVWDADEEYCGLNAADFNLMIADYEAGWGNMSASASVAACYAVTTEAECVTACAWSGEEQRCKANVATADAALTNASVPAGVRGFAEVQTTSSTTCGPAGTANATNCADPKCVLETENNETSCQPTVEYSISTMQEKCGANGAAALATAQTANGVSSGADVAAPLMVVLSTLVAALAIFA